VVFEVGGLTVKKGKYVVISYNYFMNPSKSDLDDEEIEQIRVYSLCKPIFEKWSQAGRTRSGASLCTPAI